jgi:hypothetical protein
MIIVNNPLFYDVGVTHWDPNGSGVKQRKSKGNKSQTESNSEEGLIHSGGIHGVQLKLR